MDQDTEIDVVHKLLLLPAGYDIDIEATLWVRRYEHPMWAVEWETEGHTKSKVDVKEFDSPLEAAKFFVAKRHEMKLGLEYWFPNE